ncbi:MAG: type I pantothenate kinase, partial [Streptococcus mitis]|nr:type I pantothenate kinase [Streptococcus mitis]
ELVTTDGFLYPNQTLTEQGILNRKGFPESYDMETLLNFLDRIKNGQDVDIPVYSHEVYDIVPEAKQRVKAADFLIVEGINVFQNPQNERLYITDFFDFSIYVDAAVDDIESWYLDRFLKMLSLAQNDPDSYYYRFTQMPIGEVESFAHQVWTSINLTNLQNYIEPTRNRAEVILHKTKNHEIDEIYLKK